MVESTGLENRHTWEGIGGSNPPSSEAHIRVVLGV